MNGCLLHFFINLGCEEWSDGRIEWTTIKKFCVERKMYEKWLNMSESIFFMMKIVKKHDEEVESAAFLPKHVA